MRKVTVFALLITGAGLLVLLPAVTDGQPGGGRFGKGGPGGPNLNADPDALFEFYAKGRSFFMISETRSLNGPLTAYVQDKGISGGMITRQQFKDFMADMKAKAGAPGAAPPQQPGFIVPGGPGGYGGFKKKGGGDPGAGMANADPTSLYPFADAEFKRRDANGDNKLVPEEMPPSLRANLAKWDKNGDGFIDIVEYRDYYVARLQGSEDAGFQGNKGVAAIIIDEEDLDRKPVVFRVGGKQPPGLPDWFNKLDTDKDGQVALYEWRTSGKSMDDFKKWDLNDDGFITAEEAAKVQSLVAKDNPTKGSLASASDGGDGTASEPRQMWPGKMGGADKKGGGFQWPGGGGFGKDKGGKGGGKGKRPGGDNP